MKATLTDGTVLEGQPAEIAEAVRELTQRSAPITNIRNNNPQKVSTGPVSVWNEDNVRNLWNFLYGKQKELVRFLVQRGGKATIQEVMKALNLNKGSEVAGLRSCITRNSRRETGNKKAELIAWERTPRGERHYKINTEAFEVLRSIT